MYRTINFKFNQTTFGVKANIKNGITKACDEWQGPLLSAWATPPQGKVAAVASRNWRQCVRFDRPGNRTPHLPIDSDMLYNGANGK